MLIKKWNKTRKVFLWYVRLINEHGKKELYSPGHTSKKVASLYESKLKNEIAERKMFPGRYFPRVNFADLAKEYLEKHAARTRSYADYWSISNKLKKAFGDLYIRDIGRHEIESYQAERSTQVGACMVNREIIIMKGMYTKAIDWGYTDKNPVKGIKLAKEKERTRFVNGYERTKLLQAAGGKGRPWYLKSGIIIDLFTGLRKSELLRVTWPDINLERNELRVVEGKGGEGRVVPINTAAREEILKLAKKAKGKYLFTTATGGPSPTSGKHSTRR
jgi:integrase